MCSASGRMALRVRMDLLAKRFDFLSGDGSGLANPVRRSATRHIMNGEHGSERQGFVEIFTERWTQRAQIVEREILQLAVALQAQLHRFAISLVRHSRWNSATYQVRCRRPCIDEA